MWTSVRVKYLIVESANPQDRGGRTAGRCRDGGRIEMGGVATANKSYQRGTAVFTGGATGSA